MSTVLATPNVSFAPTTIAAPSIVGIPPLSVQWEQARFFVASRNADEVSRKCYDEAVRHANDSARKHEEEAARTFEAELEQLHLREMGTAAAVDAQERARWEAKEAARSALKNPEKIELAEFPQAIADAKHFELDAAAIAVAERVYRERTVSAFVAQRAEDRFRQAVALGRADRGPEPSPETQFVVRAVPVPLPVVVTTQVTTLAAEGQQRESEKKHCEEKKGESAREEDEAEEERSTCAGSDQEPAGSQIVSAAASDEGDDVAPEKEIVAL